MENSGNKREKFYIAIIIFLLLMNCGAGYLWYKDNSAKKDLEVVKADLDTQYQTLLTDLDAKKSELEQYKGKNAELDSVIAARQLEIDRYRGEIEGLLKKGKITAAELGKARELIKQLQAENAEFQRKVDELTKNNEILTAENQTLGQNLEQEKATTAQLSDEKTKLSKKVELGSLLKLAAVQVVGVKAKSNGKEVETKRVKQVQQLRITFETGDNKVLESGTLPLYVRIINPKGETISVRDQGSGTFKAADDNSDIQFSKKADIDFQNANKKVTVYWGSNITAEGKYKVEVYQSGYLIGRGETELK
jgi:uncharacterized protein YdcH (DUF465 family)